MLPHIFNQYPNKDLVLCKLFIVSLHYFNNELDFPASFIQKSSGKICLDGVHKEENPTRIEWCHGSNLRLMDPPGPLTGLWSFPGSGNSWLRYLIQKATGYVTGSEYEEKKNWPDFPGFPGGDISNGSAIVVKSHLYE